VIIWKKMVLLIAAVCFAALCFNGLVLDTSGWLQKPPSKRFGTNENNIHSNLLIEGQWNNLSIINATFTSLESLEVAASWLSLRLQSRLETGRSRDGCTDGWNSPTRQPCSGHLRLEIVMQI